MKHIKAREVTITVNEQLSIETSAKLQYTALLWYNHMLISYFAHN